MVSKDKKQIKVIDFDLSYETYDFAEDYKKLEYLMLQLENDKSYHEVYYTH
jgi:hypothetical protein